MLVITDGKQARVSPLTSRSALSTLPTPFNMLTETHLVQEFTRLAERSHPQAGTLLQQCHLKLVTAHWGQPPHRLDYIAIYCPDALFQAVSAQKTAFRTISRYMGLAEPICMNATRLLRDPKSKLKQAAPRFWLELHRLLPTQAPDSDRK